MALLWISMNFVRIVLSTWSDCMNHCCGDRSSNQNLRTSVGEELIGSLVEEQNDDDDDDIIIMRLRSGAAPNAVVGLRRIMGLSSANVVI